MAARVAVVKGLLGEIERTRSARTASLNVVLKILVEARVLGLLRSHGRRYRSSVFLNALMDDSIRVSVQIHLVHSINTEILTHSRAVTLRRRWDEEGFKCCGGATFQGSFSHSLITSRDFGSG